MEILTGEVAVAVYYVVLAAVLTLAATKGGRYERRLALVISVASLTNFITQFLFKQLVPILPFSIIDFIVFCSIVRIFRRYRRTFVGAMTILQFLVLIIDFYFLLNIGMSSRAYLATMNGLYYVIFGLITFGVIRRRVGPPLPVPVPQSARPLLPSRYKPVKVA